MKGLGKGEQSGKFVDLGVGVFFPSEGDCREPHNWLYMRGVGL